MKTCLVCSFNNAEDADFCNHCAAALARKCLCCGHTNAPESKFCGECGTSLTSLHHCLHCGEPLQPNSKFCNQCGYPVQAADVDAESPRTPKPSPISPTAARPLFTNHTTTGQIATKNGMPTELQGERREVTVLFLDLMDFTRLSKQVDSEEIYLIVDEAMRLLVQIIYRYEGTVDKFTGDGLMALFGTPTAHENDPERAVRSALEMQQVLKPLQQRIQDLYGFNFQARIGINTGVVIAGNLGSDLHMEYTVIGDTVNLAARLEAAAKPGTILVSYDTYQRTRPIFRYQPMPPFDLKGFPEPVPAYRPLSVRKHPGRVRGLPGMQSPMIGRIDELTLLHKIWARVQKEHRNQTVLITGEAGMGKSRLASEFRREIDGTTSNIFEGNCLAFARSKPFWVFASLLRDILQISELDTPAHQFESLRLFVEHLNLPKHQLLPYLSIILGLEQLDERSTERLLQIDPNMLQRQTYVAVRQMFLAMSQAAPLILLFDDLHWVDPASKELLIYLIQSLTEASVLIVLISRNLERKTTIRPLLEVLQRSTQRFTDVELGRLGDSEAIQLLAQLLKQSTHDNALLQLEQRIVQRAEGNPFYIEEIVRMLIDQQILVKQNGRFVVATNTDQTLAHFPATLRSLILTRFDGLSENLRQILQKAAVLGRSFPLSLLQALHRNESEQVALQVYDLKNRLFLSEDPFNHEPGFTFYHALIQEAIYSTMLNRDRKSVHGMVAQALERGNYFNDDERIEALGYHYANSNEPYQAIPYLIAAAENASRRSAHETAIEHYRHALTLMAEQSDPDGNDFIRLRLGLGHTLKLKGEFNESSQMLQEAIDWLSKSNTELNEKDVNLIEGLRELADVRQREGSLDEAFEHLETAVSLCDRIEGERHLYLWYALIDRMAWIRFRLGQLDEAEQLATQAIHNLDKQEQAAPALLASLYNTLGGTRYQQGAPSEAIPYVEKSLQLHDVLGYTWGKAVAHINLGVLYYVQGMWSSAIEHYTKADFIEQENGFMAERAVNLRNLGLLHIGRGAHEQARQDYETSLSISRHIGDSTGVGCCHIGLAHLAFIQGQLDEATQHIQAAQEEADALGEDHFMQLLLIQARIHAETGAIQSAFELASQVLQMAQSSGLSEEEVEAYRILGRLHMLSGEYMKSESLLRQSLDLSRQRRNPYQEGLALLEMGMLFQAQVSVRQWHRNELSHKAEEVLSQAAEAFELLGAQHDLETVQRLRQELRAASLPATVPDFASTPSVKYHTQVISNGHEHTGERHTVAVVWLQLLPIAGNHLEHPIGKDDHALESIRGVTAEVSAVALALEGKMVHQPGGICIIFGLNGMHVDAPERAMRAAWHLRQAFTQRGEKLAIELQYCVSLGEVTTGRFAVPVTNEALSSSDPVQEAARIAQNAESDRIWVTPGVRAATQHLFVFAHSSTNGVAEAVQMQAMPDLHQRLTDMTGTFIGRASLLESMLQLAQHLPNNEGGVIWLEGEAGMGTSRLMHEFATRMQIEDARLWRASCSAQTTRTPLALFRNLLMYAFGLSASDTQEESRAKMRRSLQRLIPSGTHSISRNFDEYIDLLCRLETDETASSLYNSLEPQELRQQIFVNVRTLLHLASQNGPLILLLDDLHWIDPMSAELLLFLSNLVLSSPVLFICTQRSRPEQLPAPLRRMQSLYPVYNLHVHVQPLDRSESQALIADLLKQNALSTEVCETILVRSHGNPYFLKELVRTALEHNRLVSPRAVTEDDVLNKSTGDKSDELLIPGDLRSLLQARINSLSPALKKMLQYMSVLGRPAASSLLATLTQQPNIELLLQQLVRKGLLNYFIETDRWQISHWLTENIVYDGLLKIQQQILHREIAETLESLWRSTDAVYADELAYHFAQANEPQKAVHYHIKAAEYAAAVAANEEATTHYLNAQTLLANTLGIDDEMRWQVASGLGATYMAVGKYSESAATLEQILPLETPSPQDRAVALRRLSQVYQKQGKTEEAIHTIAQAIDLLANISTSAAQLEKRRLYISRAWTYFFAGELPKAQEDCRHVLAQAIKTNSLREQSAAHSLLGGIHHSLGNWPEAIKHIEIAMEMRRQVNYSWGVAAMLNNLGLLSISAGKWKQARQYISESLSLRRDMGDVEGISTCHINLGKLAAEMGDLEDSELHYRAGLKIAEHINAPYLGISASIGLARGAFLRNDLVNAEELISVGVQEAESLQVQDLVLEAQLLQAEILLGYRQYAQAELLATQVALAAQSGSMPVLEVVAWRIVCEAQIAQGSPKADESLQRGQKILSNVNNPLEQVRWSVLVGKMYQLNGKLREAQAQFMKARHTLNSLDASHELSLVESILHGMA